MLSRIEEILTAIINDEKYNKAPLSRVEALLIQLEAKINDISSVGGFAVVDTLPTTDIDKKKIYLVPKDDPQYKNLFYEYVYTDLTGWELLGTDSIDFSNYYTKEEIDQMLDGVTVTVDYTRLDNKPSIEGHELNGDMKLEDIGIVEISSTEIDSLFES